VNEVQPGSSNVPVGSLVITMDAATAGSSAGSLVDLSLPAQPPGFGLTVAGSVYRLVGAIGSVSVTNDVNGDPDLVSIMVNSLSPTSNQTQIVLPLTVSVPPGFNGSITLTALAPPGSVLTSANNLTPASLGADVLRVDPDSAGFGSIAVGSTSSVQVLAASDIGASSLSISSVSITGPNAGDFQVSQDACRGRTLTNGQHATLGVIFTPSAVGARRAVLHFFSSDPLVPDYQVSLTGTGLAVAGATTVIAVFKIGAGSFTVNGTVYKADVAPYIKDGRVFLPLRYIANAAGITNSAIMWDPVSQTVTIGKGCITVQLTIGSTTMLINGKPVVMDAAPEIADGRTCLPVAWVAKALGAKIQWEATSQTVTITF
jgi:hypothetical protein